MLKNFDLLHVYGVCNFFGILKINNMCSLMFKNLIKMYKAFAKF